MLPSISYITQRRKGYDLHIKIGEDHLVVKRGRSSPPNTDTEKCKSKNNSPPDGEPSEGKNPVRSQNKTKKQGKNHTQSGSEGGSSGFLAAAGMRAGPASGWLKQSMSGGRGLGHASRC